MTLPLVFDDGARFTESFCVRSPRTLRDALVIAADAEGISQAEFARRAIAERIARATNPGDAPATPAPQTAET